MRSVIITTKDGFLVAQGKVTMDGGMYEFPGPWSCGKDWLHKTLPELKFLGLVILEERSATEATQPPAVSPND